MWELLTDPLAFAIDHWPAIVIVLFACSLPWMWTTYMVLLRARVTWELIGLFVVMSLVWTIRGRWDADQFDKERASFHETLQQIDEQNQQAVIDAQKETAAKEVQSRQNLKDAFLQFQLDTSESDAEREVQKEIDAMPDVAVAPSAPCPVDPVLQKIIRGRK